MDIKHEGLKRRCLLLCCKVTALPSFLQLNVNIMLGLNLNALARVVCVVNVYCHTFEWSMALLYLPVALMSLCLFLSLTRGTWKWSGVQLWGR